MRYLTGCKALDDLFGGYQTKVITQVYGPTKSGKTTLSAYVPIGRIYQQLKRALGDKFPKNGRFFVVDGDGGFDFERAEQVWRGIGLSDDDVNDIKERLIFWQPTTFKEQHEILASEGKKKPSTIQRLIKEDKLKPLLVCADPLTAIYRGIILRTSHKMRLVTIGDYTGKLDLQLVSLRGIAVKEDCPVTISSWDVSPLSYVKIGDEEPKPPEQPMIGGRAFGYIPKCIVELRILQEGSPVREAYLYKHRSRPEGKTAVFRLSDKGIEDLKKVGE